VCGTGAAEQHRGLGAVKRRSSRYGESTMKLLPFCARLLAAVAALAAAGFGQSALAQAAKYGPGASATEIKLGQTMPYSGPASAYGTIGKVEMAYFKMINDRGGVNGRQINLISLDDGYSPPKTVEQVRRLVEQEEVLALFQTLGTPPNSAIHKYVNAKKVPHLLLATGATQWGDPKNFPWTMGFNLSYQSEGQIYAKWLLKNKPNAKVAILYQNDDYGKDVLKGVKDGLGAAGAKMIIAEATYEVTDPTIDSPMIKLQGSGADTFIDIATPKFAAQAVRKAYDSGWKPLHLLNNVSNSVGAVLTPAGLDKAVGLLTVEYAKDPTDAQWNDDPAMLEWRAFMGHYYRDGDPKDAFNLYGYVAAQTMVQILKQCGNDLTRENVMRQAANLKNLKLPLLLPGMAINTSPTDFFPIEQAELAKFNGTQWKLFGDLIGTDPK
jgi:branched-chain amino acid transport system substrate-binding protein